MPAPNNLNSRSLPELLPIFAMAFLGCEVTAALVSICGLPKVATSAAITLIAVFSALRARLSEPALLAVYSGTFAGMGAIPVETHMLMWLTVMSLVAASVFVAFHCLQSQFPAICLPGVGGRLGFFAFVGYSVFSWLFLWRSPVFQPELVGFPNLLTNVLGMVLGASATTELRRQLPVDTVTHNVLASAAVGIVGSVFCMADWKFGQPLSAAIYTGSFIGMSTLASLRPSFILVSSAIAAIAYTIASVLFSGWGGLLGSAAAGGVVLTRQLVLSQQGLKALTENAAFPPSLDPAHRVETK